MASAESLGIRRRASVCGSPLWLHGPWLKRASAAKRKRATAAALSRQHNIGVQVVSVPMLCQDSDILFSSPYGSKYEAWTS